MPIHLELHRREPSGISSTSASHAAVRRARARPGLTEGEIAHLFEALRHGRVPERGIGALAVGLDRELDEMERQLALAESGAGGLKFIRGGYGCGKTFLARLVLQKAQAKGFATSFIVVSESDLKLHRLGDVYRKLMSELSTPSCSRGAFGAILREWLATFEGKGLGSPKKPRKQMAPRNALDEALDRELESLSRREVPHDFLRGLRSYVECVRSGERARENAIVSWLTGSESVSAPEKSGAGIKGDLKSGDALQNLRGVVEIVRAAGYSGMVAVIDEAETILRMRSDARHASLSALRQIADASGSYPGMLWIVTGTPQFFDSKYGVAGLRPLHDRIHFLTCSGYASARQAQLELRPFDAKRLEALAMHLRALYPSKAPKHYERTINEAFIERLIEKYASGIRSEVGIVPRHFLRELITHFDLADEYEAYAPWTEEHITQNPPRSEATSGKADRSHSDRFLHHEAREVREPQRSETHEMHEAVW